MFSGGAGEASARSETKRARGQGVSGGASPPLRAAARGRRKALGCSGYDRPDHQGHAEPEAGLPAQGQNVPIGTGKQGEPEEGHG